MSSLMFSPMKKYKATVYEAIIAIIAIIATIAKHNSPQHSNLPKKLDDRRDDDEEDLTSNFETIAVVHYLISLFIRRCLRLLTTVAIEFSVTCTTSTFKAISLLLKP